jgi:hypothetical protein
VSSDDEFSDLIRERGLLLGLHEPQFSEGQDNPSLSNWVVIENYGVLRTFEFDLTLRSVLGERDSAAMGLDEPS